MNDYVRHNLECAGDKVGANYWDGTYKKWDVKVFKPDIKGVRYFGRMQWHGLFTRVFNTYALARGHLIEIGCGGSGYLPYFASEFNFNVAGVDYSVEGCILAEKNMKFAGLKGMIYHGDLFSPPQGLIETFDVAVSFGLVEHFTHPVECIAQISRFLKPGGLIITTVPNMEGLAGLAQKFLARDVYNKHTLLSKLGLSSAHTRSGLKVLEAGYLEFLNFGVVNVGTTSSGMVKTLRILFHKVLLAVTLGVWCLEAFFGPFAGNRITSPHVYCIAEKPGQ